MLDLHGLHVSEGLKILSREISQLQSNSKGRVPVIKQEVRRGTDFVERRRWLCAFWW